jgi:integrase
LPNHSGPNEKLPTDAGGRLTRSSYYQLQVMRLLWNWAVAEGHVDDTPFRERRVKRAAPAAKLIWTDADEAALLDARDESGQGPPPLVARALLLGLYTGQRPGDLLRLGWNDLRDGGTALELRQRKTGPRSGSPCTDACARRSRPGRDPMAQATRSSFADGAARRSARVI